MTEKQLLRQWSALRPHERAAALVLAREARVTDSLPTADAVIATARRHHADPRVVLACWGYVQHPRSPMEACASLVCRGIQAGLLSRKNGYAITGTDASVRLG